MGRKEEHIVGLDVGSMKVSTLIAAARESGLQPLGLGVAESKGIKKGSVVNLEAVAESIKRSVGEAEAMAGCEIETVYVGLAGGPTQNIKNPRVAFCLYAVGGDKRA